MNTQAIYSINSARAHLRHLIKMEHANPVLNNNLVLELIDILSDLSEAAAHLESDQAQEVHS